MSCLETKKKIDLSYVRQPNDYSCVPSTVKMLVDYYIPGNAYSKKNITDFCKTTKHGTLFGDAIKVMEALGFEVWGIKTSKNYTQTAAYISAYISKDTPVWTAYTTECKYSDHMSIITGYDLEKEVFYLHDPMYGKNFKLPMGTLLYCSNEFFTVRPT